MQNMPNKSHVDLGLALEAVSNDLDAMGSEIALIAGNEAETRQVVEALRTQINGIDHKLDDMIDLLRSRLIPATDEIEPIRRRVVDVEDQVQRHLALVPRDAE